ncbi:hypothetical protein [Rathayibacter iranicus]|uniref:Uncharacterized protein n=2 Tax=Rathayibacter iranicus TaxID=59737 RepID=A0AAD1AC83_9MICO|nr:hypothetical protein [Rathayibacter iranicus]AZZ55671.1 hypothetical protein C7V51_07065 [Rathayibacter iranicus]MWV31152.1 hypothetical protein [Rathayibacter iranicus NCPPB 2253 = VKM Ac-1602]PPI47941.1 hypothetical protein C5E09_06115 [Rathayibacter iranicus]PPI61092.1 hypothetical protein C5E08_07045 [Rathayibacter iranicus]PPI72932.1 hypothetical protein C5E01_03605 [Rathayibacter iranicus]
MAKTMIDRLLEMAAHQLPRRRISDGTFGYFLEAKTVLDVRMGADPFDETAPTETLELYTTECEVRVPDPTMTADGTLRYDLEIYRLITVGRSRTLFGKDVPVKLLVGRGVDPMIRPTFGRLEVAEDVAFGTEPVTSTQLVNLVLETPMGYIHNREAAVMQSQVTHIPPVKLPYVQQGMVPLYLEGNETTPVAVKRKASSTLASTIEPAEGIISEIEEFAHASAVQGV